MNWKDDLKQIVIGLPLLWMFMIGGGLLLGWIERNYWVWLIIIFIVGPLIMWAAPILYRLKRKGS